MQNCRYVNGDLQRVTNRKHHE